MSSVGRTLRTERLSQHRELADIADEMCVAPAYLTAIETDDLKNLPGTFFYKSFVSQYANALGIDFKKLKPGVEALTAARDAELNPLPIRPCRTQQFESIAVRSGFPIRSWKRPINSICRAAVWVSQLPDWPWYFSPVPASILGGPNLPIVSRRRAPPSTARLSRTSPPATRIRKALM